MPKELFNAGQGGNSGTVKTTLADTDRLATGVPGQNGSDNIEFADLRQQIIGTNSSFAGVTTIPSFVDNGDGSVTLGNFKVRIFDNSNYDGRASEMDVDGNTFTLADNDTTYIVVNYNAGTPILVALTNGQYSTINQSDILPVITISRTGNILHYFPTGFGTYGNGLPNRILDDIAKTRRLTKEAGGINIVQRADRVVEITAGVGRLLIQPYTVAAFTSGQASNFLWDVYYNGTTWLYNSAATVWDNLQRNPTTGLVALGDNQWGFIYVFRGIEEAKHAYFIRSQNEYGTASAAKAAAFGFDARSYAPTWLTRHALPIAVIVFQKSATSGTAYQYNIVQGAIFGAAGLELSPAGASGDVQYNDGAGSLVTYGQWKNNFNTNTKTYTEGLYPVAKLLGEKATSNSRFSNDGDSEKRLIQLRLAVNDATPSNMFIGTSSTAGVILPVQISGWAFRIKVVGVKSDGSSAAFFFEGCIQRKSDTTVSFAGTPLKTSYIDASLTGVDAAVIANNTDKRLDVQVTGLAETNIRWTAVVDVAQSVWGTW